jgi:hypothetical protein
VRGGEETEQAELKQQQAFHGSGLKAIEQKRAAGNDPTHGATAAVRRADANVTRKREAREWDEQHGKLVDVSAFQRDILPLIQNVPLSQLQRATGLSLRYVSLIRRGGGRRIRCTSRCCSERQRREDGAWS